MRYTTAALLGLPALGLCVAVCLPIWQAGAGLSPQQVDWLVRLPLLWCGGTSVLVSVLIAATPANR